MVLGGGVKSECCCTLLSLDDELLSPTTKAGPCVLLVGGKEISRVKSATEAYFEYVPEENAITFFNLSFSQGDAIVIAYKAWEKKIQ